MAYDATKIVLELEAQTGAFKVASKDAAQTFDQATSQIERGAVRVEKAIVNSTRLAGHSARNLGRQWADVGTQLSMPGVSPLLVLQQQLPQFLDAMADGQGKMAAFARFMTNPWVSAGLAAASVLATLYMAQEKQGDSLDDLVEKMKKHARESDLSARAAEIFAKTLDGEREAARKLQEQLKDGIKTQQDATDATYREAQAHLANELALRRVLAARLADAEAAARILGGPGISSERGIGLAQRQARLQAETLREQIKRNDEEIKRAEQNVLGVAGQVAADQAARATDPIQRINDQYDQMAANARKASLENRELAKSLEGLDAAGRRAALGRERQRLTAELADIERRRQAALKSEQERQRRARQTPDADSTQFRRPVEGGRITGNFGEQRPGHAHGGVDIAVPVGTRVTAAAGGTVIEAGIVPGYGRVVVIDHGRGTITRYAHLSGASVFKGQTVAAGDVIGLSGGALGEPGSGNSRGPHLHYEVRRNGRSVNPFGGPFPTDSFSAQGKGGTTDPFADLKKSLDGLKERLEEAQGEAIALEKEFDPAASRAREFAEVLQRIERVRLMGLIDDATALRYRMEATVRALKPLLDEIKEPLRQASRLRETMFDRDKDTLFGAKDAALDAQRRSEDQIRDLADLYSELFTNGTRNIWAEFKRQALEALAIIAAQETFRLITGKSIDLSGGRGGGDIFSMLTNLSAAVFGGGGGLSGNEASTFAQLFSGRATGGPVAPGQTYLVGERGPELLRMGAMGGHVIPNHALGGVKAASPASGVTLHQSIHIDSRGSVNPQGYADHIRQAVRRDTVAIVEQAGKVMMKGVPARLAQYQSDGT